MRCSVEAVGIVAPGLSGWNNARPILAGEAGYLPGELALPKLEILPPVERRRTGLLVKLAIAAGQDALAQSGQPSAELATVFASSDSDGDVIDEICRTLAGTDRQISPTRFHNSVHNAAAGYWSIATGSHAPSTSLSAFNWSFAAGLIEAATQIMADAGNVLLIAYEAPYPEPLTHARPTQYPFGCALLLARERSNRSMATLDIELRRGGSGSTMEDPPLEALRSDNSAAYAVPLLAALARRASSLIVVEYVAGNTVEIAVEPC